MSPVMQHYKRCYISAPIGLSLGSLPELLGARAIGWEWANNGNFARLNSLHRIESADFMLVVLNGTRADYQGLFDAGIGLGLKKPIFILQAKSRPLPVDLKQFQSAKVSLTDRSALEFHLDLFLATPSEEARKEVPLTSSVDRNQAPFNSVELHFESDLERRAFNAVSAAGGSAISEPTNNFGSRYRPDLLASFDWVKSDLDGLVAIEVKSSVAAKDASKVEDRIMKFLTGARVSTSFIITADDPPVRDQQLSQNIFWISISRFESLAQSGRLGAYVRETRNRIMHGLR